MASIGEGLRALALGRGPEALYAACEKAPRTDEPLPTPGSSDYRGPIAAGDSLDDVTAAWTAGKLSDAQYAECLRRATRG